MVETFLSVLKSKESPRKIYKIFKKLLLLKLITILNRTEYVDPGNMLLSVKWQRFFKKNSVRESLLLNSSVYVSFLKSVDQGKPATKTSYYSLMKKYAGIKFAQNRAENFLLLYKNFKRTTEIQPVILVKNNKNLKYSILDGHHRTAIMNHLGKNKIPSKIISYKVFKLME